MVQGGNLRGCSLLHSLSSETMQSVAADAGFSETAFIEIVNNNTQRIRFFAPSKEVALCGHATVASYSWLFQQNHIPQGAHTMLCKAGPQQIIVEEDGSISMSQNLPTFGPKIPPQEVLHALGIQGSQPSSTLPIQVASTGLNKNLSPFVRFPISIPSSPIKKKSRVSIQNNAIGMYCYTRETLHNSTAHCRNLHLSLESWKTLPREPLPQH